MKRCLKITMNYLGIILPLLIMFFGGILIILNQPNSVSGSTEPTVPEHTHPEAPPHTHFHTHSALPHEHAEHAHDEFEHEHDYPHPDDYDHDHDHDYVAVHPFNLDHAASNYPITLPLSYSQNIRVAWLADLGYTCNTINTFGHSGEAVRCTDPDDPNFDVSIVHHDQTHQPYLDGLCQSLDGQQITGDLSVFNHQLLIGGYEVVSYGHPGLQLTDITPLALYLKILNDSRTTGITQSWLVTYEQRGCVADEEGYYHHQTTRRYNQQEPGVYAYLVGNKVHARDDRDNSIEPTTWTYIISTNDCLGLDYDEFGLPYTEEDVITLGAEHDQHFVCFRSVKPTVGVQGIASSPIYTHSN